MTILCVQAVKLGSLEQTCKASPKEMAWSKICDTEQSHGLLEEIYKHCNLESKQLHKTSDEAVRLTVSTIKGPLESGFLWLIPPIDSMMALQCKPIMRGLSALPLHDSE